MREFLQSLTNQASSRWDGLSQPWRLALVGVFVALILSLIVSLFVLRSGDYVTLYSGLSDQDRGVLAHALDQQGIDYKLTADEIQVEVKDIDAARRISTTTQLSGGIGMFGERTLKRQGDRGYEILAPGALRMMSRDEFREFKRQALEGELERTLSTFAGIRAVAVKLSIPESQPFVREQEAPTASVTVELMVTGMDDDGLTVSSIKAMQRVVAYSVAGLKPANVHVVDQDGIYDSEELVKTNQTSTDKSAEVLNLKEKYESYYLNKARKAIAIYEDRVRIAGLEVEVSLTDTKTLKSEFKPSLSDAGTGVIRSKLTERESFEGEGSAPGGEPGVESNLFPPEYQTAGSGSGPSTYDKSKEITNYEMDQVTTEETSTPTAIVKSAAIVVDFSLQDEVEAIKNTVANTLGLSASAGLNDTISIQITQFPVVKDIQEAIQELPPPVWVQLAQMIVLAVVLIAILIFLRSWLARPSSSHEALDEPPMVHLGEEHLPKGLTVKDYIDQLLNEQFAYMKKEHEESQEQVQIERVANEKKEEHVAQQEAEEQAQVEAIEAEKMAQEEEVLREETESERQKDVFEHVKEFAEADPGATADVLRTWLATGDDSTSGTDSSGDEDSAADEES